VFFDLDDTLFDYYAAADVALDGAYLFLRKHVRISRRRFLEVFGSAKKKVRKDLGHSPDSHDRIVYFQELGYKLGLDLDLTLSLYDVYYKYYLNAMKIKEGVVATFRTLKKRGFKIGIITNEFVEIQLRKTRKLGVLGYVDFFISDEDVGVDKPDKKVFRYALKKAGVSASRAVMVGDSLKCDVVGANQMGITSVLLGAKNGRGKRKADFVISKIPEVLGVLDEV